MTKFLDKTGLAYFWEKVKAWIPFLSRKTQSIPFGQVDSTSTSTVFTATVDGITELRDGVFMYLRNGVVDSASGFTININGLGAKPVYQNIADDTRVQNGFSKAKTFLFAYNSTRVSGGCWDIYYGISSITTDNNSIGYQLRTNSGTLPAKFKTYRYRLLFTSSDGNYFVGANADTTTNATAVKTPTTEKIDPFGEIVYYGSTTVVNENDNFNTTILWQQIGFTLGYSFNNTGVALVLDYPKPVYIKCAPQTDGSAIIDATTPYVQSLPSTEDGKIYIYLGIAYSATNVDLHMKHPVYYYKDGAIREWTNAAETDVSGKVDKSSQSIANDTAHADTYDTTQGKKVTIGITSGTANVDVVPHSLVTGEITGTVATDKTKIPTAAASQQYSKKLQNQILSRGENLVINCNGYMLDNTNFGSFTFTQVETNGSYGSFYKNGKGSLVSAYSLPINPSYKYRVGADVKRSVNVSGNDFYVFLNFLDADNYSIMEGYCYYVNGTETELSQDLNSGDTVIHVADLSGWVETTSTQYYVSVYNWTNSKGYTYPPYTYTRRRLGYGSNSNIDVQNSTITLSSAYSGATIPAGTKIAKQRGGTGTYLYAKSSSTTTEWKRVEGYYNAYQQNKAGIPFAAVKANFAILYGYGNNSTSQTTWFTNAEVTALASITDVDKKVDKVVSTDDAVVRFNGTSGAVQNSGVTINDSNHITAEKFIKSDGTSSQFLKADGSVDSNTYATDTNAVHKTGAETIAGQKTFSTGITLDSASLSFLVGNNGGSYIEAGFDNVSDTQILMFGDSADDSPVRLTNIATPVDNADAATKAYVDSELGRCAEFKIFQLSEYEITSSNHFTLGLAFSSADVLSSGMYKVTTMLHIWYEGSSISSDFDVNVAVSFRRNEASQSTYIIGGTYIARMITSPNSQLNRMASVVVYMTGFISLAKAVEINDNVYVAIDAPNGVCIGGDHPLAGTHIDAVSNPDFVLFEKIGR